MKLTPLDTLAPGMTLAEAVRNGNGDVLVKAEVTLTERHIRLFRMWGVSAAAVHDNASAPPTAASAADEALLEQAEAGIKRYFQHSLSNEVMAEVFRIAVSRYAAELARKKVQA